MMYDPLFIGGLGPNVFSSYDNSCEAARATEAARSAEEHIRTLERRVDRLLLVAQTMWQILCAKSATDEQGLLNQVNQLAQQHADAIKNPENFKCPQCGRGMSPHAAKCMYCGATRPIQSVFQAI